MPEDDASTEDELDRIKRRKMAEILRLQKQREEQEARVARHQKSLEEKRAWLLEYILQPSAQQYLAQVRTRNPGLAQRIENMIVTPQVLAQLDLLLQLIRIGRLPRNIIPVTEIQYLERKILGVKSKITVKKRGEDHVDLSSFLSQDK